MKVEVKQETQYNCLSLILMVSEATVRPVWLSSWVGMLNLYYLSISVGSEGSFVLSLRYRIIGDRTLSKTSFQMNGG